MQVSSSALQNIQQLVAAKNYSAAYAATLADLQSNYPAATGSDADVLTWLNIAQQVNSGAQTPAAVAIRANNAAAVQYETGNSIGLFGPEEQASSDAVATAFFLFEGWLAPHLASGALEPVLEPWWQTFAGPFLYYPGRRHLPAPLRAFVDFIRDADR
jgi:DNA-binding transcriptional LysR family regulator